MLTINKDTTNETLLEILEENEAGTIIKADDYETSVYNLNNVITDSGRLTTWADIRPGTSLYAAYGTGHILLITNEPPPTED